MLKRRPVHHVAGWLCISMLIAGPFAGAPSRVGVSAGEPEPATRSTPVWSDRPLSMIDALNLALDQNEKILRSSLNVAETHGVRLRTRAVALPNLRLESSFIEREEDSYERIVPSMFLRQSWVASLELSQPIYDGGRLRASLKTADLLRARAEIEHETLVEDVMLEVREAYYRVLLADALVSVRRASVEQKQNEVNRAKIEFDSGGATRFEQVRAEVQLAAARPGLIRAVHSRQIAAQDLIRVLGFDLANREDPTLELNLTDPLAPPVDGPQPNLGEALDAAVRQSGELAILDYAIRIRGEALKIAGAGYKPRVELFAAYGSRNSLFNDDLTDTIRGWNAGGRLTWDLFDGLETKGRVGEARAILSRTRAESESVRRTIEARVRTAYFRLRESLEVLESQERVAEQAEEALRLARLNFQTGTITQLEVQEAETALTESRTSEIQALHDYQVAIARMERAIGSARLTDRPGQPSAPESELPSSAGSGSE